MLRKRVKSEFPKDEWRDAPYRLTEVHGVGFLKADAVALALGIAKDSKERLSAGAYFVLGQAEMEGHTGLPVQVFGQSLAEALKTSLPDDLDLDGDLELDADFVQRGRTAKAERAVAACIRAMMTGAHDPLPSIPMGDLADDQRQAVDALRYFPVFVLLGGPGVGKTHTIRTLIEGCEGDIALCAPTGKAAKRIEELAGRPAQTIHRLLGVDFLGRPKDAHSPGFRFHSRRNSPVQADLVIVDEASMVDIRLMADLCDALKDGARLILVGDPFQLPAVGPGAVLRDLVASASGPDRVGPGHFELTELKRQDPTLLIARNCKAIRYESRILTDNKSASDFFFLPISDPTKIVDEVLNLITERLPAKYGITPADVMVLTALREKGELSAVGLNVRLRAKLNPGTVGRWGVGKWAVGDRVIQTWNNYELDVMNGDIGTIVGVDGPNLRIVFDTPTRELRGTAGIDGDFDLMYAWALTIHRAQGSEWPWVIIPIHEQQGQMVVNANSLYTAISRARNGCVVVGSRAALEGAAARHREVRRWTRLASLLS